VACGLFACNILGGKRQRSRSYRGSWHRCRRLWARRWARRATGAWRRAHLLGGVNFYCLGTAAKSHTDTPEHLTAGPALIDQSPAERPTLKWSLGGSAAKCLEPRRAPENRGPKLTLRTAGGGENNRKVKVLPSGITGQQGSGRGAELWSKPDSTCFVASAAERGVTQNPELQPGCFDETSFFTPSRQRRFCV